MRQKNQLTQEANPGSLQIDAKEGNPSVAKQDNSFAKLPTNLRRKIFRRLDNIYMRLPRILPHNEVIPRHEYSDMVTVEVEIIDLMSYFDAVEQLIPENPEVIWASEELPEAEIPETIMFKGYEGCIWIYKYVPALVEINRAPLQKIKK
jgi:hypothetical protein